MDNPVHVLLEEPCPVRRSRAHLTLGQRALQGGNVVVASEHLREAVDLDPTDEAPRRLLAELDQQAQQSARRRKPSWWPF
jgi:Tfp pilus assembly protein PilF